MRAKEVLAVIIMGAWVAAGVTFMNWFGFPQHTGNVLWSIGAAISILVILMVSVAIFFAVAKESPWVWFAKDE